MNMGIRIGVASVIGAGISLIAYFYAGLAWQDVGAGDQGTFSGLLHFLFGNCNIAGLRACSDLPRPITAAYLVFLFAFPVGFLLDTLFVAGIIGDDKGVPPGYRLLAILVRRNKALESELERAGKSTDAAAFQAEVLRRHVASARNAYDHVLSREAIEREAENLSAVVKKLKADINTVEERIKSEAAAEKLAAEIRKMELLKARLDELRKFAEATSKSV